ncbi:hypothetical protein [Streptomyces sp. WMMB 322]|uniref:hypothetical protein n=1 Tax=Streptomyces sp. WMMB 322 TaxID=1286821 RepID=UPI0006E288D2|nr:hypothetical protein [Streptomyces sp. WMMB 322]
MESREGRDGRQGTAAAAAAGCLVAAAAAATGFAVWFVFARSGVAGGFEGRRDWSLLYIELPGMVAGFPLIAVLTWSLTRAVFRGRGRRGTRAVVAAAVVALTLLLLSWACGVWLEHRVDRLGPL